MAVSGSDSVLLLHNLPTSGHRKFPEVSSGLVAVPTPKDVGLLLEGYVGVAQSLAGVAGPRPGSPLPPRSVEEVGVLEDGEAVTPPKQKAVSFIEDIKREINAGGGSAGRLALQLLPLVGVGVVEVGVVEVALDLAGVAPEEY